MLYVSVTVGRYLIFRQSVRICGASFTVDHAFTCPHGGYLTLHHNEIRDITAQLISEVCPNVATEPTLQPVTNEHFFHRSANTETGARLYVRAQGFWRIHHQQAYLMLECSILWLLQIVSQLILHAFNPIIMRNVASTSNVCMMCTKGLPRRRLIIITCKLQLKETMQH